MIRRLVAGGVPLRQVARDLGLARDTVARAIANTRRRRDGSRQYTVPTYRRERATAARRKTKMYMQPTIVLGSQVGAKLRQHERWGSDTWIDKHSCRTAIGGFF